MMLKPDDFDQLRNLIRFWKWQRIGEVSQEIKRVRAQMEENEELAILMRGLRGQNLRDSQFAEDNIQLRLVEVICIFQFNHI